MDEYNYSELNIVTSEIAESFALLIPAYKPDIRLRIYVDTLIKAGFKNIVIVDDGSGAEYENVFSEVEKKGCRIVRHAVNLGKGRALKDGLNYIKLNLPECRYVVTLDCDGIQKVESIVIIAKELLNNPNAIVMASRNYKCKTVKKTRKVTNYLTRVVMALLCGVHVGDTKTTFRAFSLETAMKYITTGGERYDYETNILLESKAKETKIIEIKVDDDNFSNKASHYNPLVDSFNLYKLFLKYIFVAMLCYAVELGVFRLLMAYLQVISPLYYTVLDNVFAKICSSFVGFLIQRKRVFKSQNGNIKAVLKYYTVTMSQMILSSVFIWLLDSKLNLGEIWHIDVVVVKMMVDFVLFILGFIAQREWVFKTKSKEQVKKIDKAKKKR